MNKRQVVILSRVVSVVYLAVISYLCFARFNSLHSIGGQDKVVHFIMFFPYSFLVYGSLGKRIESGWRSLFQIILIFLSGCVVAALTEIVQIYIPYRGGDFLDFRADILSIGISSLIVFIIVICQRKS